MKNHYEEPCLIVRILQEEIITASTGKDPFDDGYTDFGDGN